jgi:hypothetical protein
MKRDRLTNRITAPSACVVINPATQQQTVLPYKSRDTYNRSLTARGIRVANKLQLPINA